MSVHTTRDSRTYGMDTPEAIPAIRQIGDLRDGMGVLMASALTHAF